MRSFDSSVNRTIETLETKKEQTVRASVDVLAFAATVAIEFRLSEDENSVDAVAMKLTMLRNQVLKLVQAGYETGVSVIELTKFDPMKPISIDLSAKSDMLGRLASARSDGMTFESIAKSVDPSGFPALLNLENYAVPDLRQ